MYALLRDLSTVGYRIAEMHDKGLAYNGLNLQTPGGECPVGGDEYQSRIEGIQNLRKRRPESSLLDGLIWLEGFQAGAKYRAHISGKSKREETSG
jgi:hypothetical protein